MKRIKALRRRCMPNVPLRQFALALGDSWANVPGEPSPLAKVARAWCLGKMSSERVL